MWKKLLPVILSLALLVGLTGCGAVPETEAGGLEGGQGEQEENMTQIANPVRPVDGPEDFAELGFAVYAPDGAEEAEYSVIDGDIPIAQVDFTLDGAHYTYRSARTEEDISGLYVNYAEESTGIALCGEYWSLELDVKPIVEGGFAGFWSQDGVASTLYTPDAVDQTVFTSLCETLAGYDWLHRSEDNWYPAEVQDPDSGVWLPAIRLTVEECSPTGGAFTIHNDGASPLTYGDAYSLEKLVDGIWRTVPVNIMETQNFGWGFNDIAYEIPSGGEDSFRIDWTWLYGTLTDGQYRLVKSVTPAEGQSPVELRAEFTSLYVINGD